MRVIRLLKCIFVPLGLAALAVVGVVTAMSDPPAATPAPAVSTDSESWDGVGTSHLVQLALSDFDANERRSDTVYQQIVVAGWASKDLLALIGTAQSDQTEGLTAINHNLQTLIENQGVLAEAAATTPPIDDRPRTLLLLALLALCWVGAWSVVPAVGAAGRERISADAVEHGSTDAEPSSPPDAAIAESGEVDSGE